jgi:hypothetical protein
MTTLEVVLAQGQVALIDSTDASLVAGRTWQHSAGYASALIRRGGGVRERVLMHRLIMAAPPGVQIDHINWNKLDNRRANLRFATATQQRANMGLQRNNTSGYKGVSLVRKSGMWRAAIRRNGEYIWLGDHHAAVEAAKAYDSAARVLFGEFAFLNFPEVEG